MLNGTLTLDPGTTKNDEGRTIKLTSETYQLAKACVLDKASEDFLLTRRDGQPIRDIRGSWDKLTEAAGLSGVLFHDLRRSAVRSMVRWGVPEVVAMRISGHKTRSVFDRYNIVNEADLVAAALKIERGRDAIGPFVTMGHSSVIAERQNSTEHVAQQDQLPV